MKKTVDIVIPTFKPDEKFHNLMQMLFKQTYQIGRILVMNTDASLFPKEGYDKLPNVEIRHLPREEFDHGGTRDRAACLLDGDIILFMTQDAVPADVRLVERLAACFEDPGIGAAYARQLPCEDCSIVEKYTRSFNYPGQSRIKSKEDLQEMGIKTFFCSNVCAAYSRSWYEKLGGFEKHTIFNEDMIFAGRLIQAGAKIAYAADAKVVHSHNYGCLEQFHRNFDMGVSQADHPEVFGMARSESEGIKLVKQTASYLCKIHKPWLIFDLVLKSGFKFLGYRMGKAYKKLPKWLVLKCTMNRHYFCGHQ